MKRAITILGAAAVAFSCLGSSLPADAHCHRHWRNMQNMGYGYGGGYANPYMTPVASSPYMASPYGVNPYMNTNPGLLQQMRYRMGF